MVGTTGRLRLSIRHACVAALTMMFAGYCTVGLCGTPQLLLNVNTTLVPESSSPQYLGLLSSKMLFGASDATGAGLWATDGTASGTVLVRRVRVLAQTVFPGSPNYMVIGDRGYFVGDDGGVSGPQLWRTDGTAAGTVPVANLGPSGTTATPLLHGVFGSLLIFSKVNASGGEQMYATDGTSLGTHALTTPAGQNVSVSSEFLVVGSKFYFAGNGPFGLAGQYSGQIWVSDGTAAGTHQVSNPFGSNSIGIDALYHPHSFTLVGSSFLYISQGLLWSVDTTTDTIGAVAASVGTPGFGPPHVNDNGGLVAMNGYVLCIADGPGFGSQELWRSDGTAAGTYGVAVTVAGPIPGLPGFDQQQYPLLKKVGDRVLVVGSDAQYGLQLWSSDGTSANTIRLTNASEPANSSFPIVIHHATVAGIAYVSISDGAQTTTWSVWRTDGTAAGTQRVGGLPSIDQSEAGNTRITGDGATVYVEIANVSGTTSLFKYEPAADRTTPLKDGLPIYILDGFTYNAGALYFSSNDPALGDEPWISDGTPGGTRLLADINPQTSDNGSNPDEFINFNGMLAYVADDGVHGRELWQSDGTAAGTVLLADINPGAGSSNPSHLYVANGVLYFFAVDASGKQKFMRLSGNPTVVETLASLSPGLLQTQYPPPPPACKQDTPALLNGSVYFAANDGSAGVELWSTDGTAAGTRLVVDINPGVGDSNPCQLTVFGGHLNFSASGPAGNELWTSDGTGAGTLQVVDIAPATASSFPSGLTVFNGALYFGADDGTHGSQLWKSNGFASGTTPLSNIVQSPGSFVIPVGIANGKLLVSAFIPDPQSLNYQEQLWATDGTISGTSNLGALIAGPGFLTKGGLAYFSSPAAVGPEPWVSDGTSAGTHLLKEVNPTAQSNLPWFADFHSITLFTVTGVSSGVQLWRSDGTPAGTNLISTVPQDIPLPTATASNRHQLTVGNTFFFVGNDPNTGSELYGLVIGSPVANPDMATSTNDQQVTINVLSNDSDADGSLDPSSVRLSTNPSHGTAASGSNGTLVYTAAAGFSGTDSFTYTVNDNQGATSNPATVTLTVTAPPAAGSGSSGGGGGGGGGALDVLELFGLLGLSVLHVARTPRQRQMRLGRKKTAMDTCTLAARMRPAIRRFVRIESANPPVWVALALICVFGMASCGGGGGNGTPAMQYTVGGSVSGLSGSGLQLQNGSGTPLAVSGNGVFSFPAALNSGSAYSVAVVTQPSNPSQTCTVASGAGTISGANVNNIAVTCKTSGYKLGGAVSGLAGGTELVLENQGIENLKITGNGSFAFNAPVSSGTSYSVAAATQPAAPDQQCNVVNGTGTMGSSDVSNITVACVTVIGADSAKSITSLGHNSSETLLQVASFLGERLTYLSGHLAANATEACADPYHEYKGGTATYSFTDNDGSGSLSPGDVVTITVSGCLSPSLADLASGTVTLTLVALQPAVTSGLGFSATANLNSLQLSDRQLTGSLDADYIAQETVYTVRARVASSPALQLAYGQNGRFQGDIVSLFNVDASRTIDYTIPQYAVQISAQFQSQHLQGQFSIATATPLKGRLGVYPVEGAEKFTAGASVLNYSARNSSDNDFATVSLDSTGLGTFTDLGAGLYSWQDGFAGFPWWEPRGFGIVYTNQSPSYQTVTRDKWQMRLMFTEPLQADPINQILSTGIDANAPIKLFFSGPVDPSSTSLAFTPAVYIVGQQTIPATSAVAGPIVTVTARTQLQHGQQYTLGTVTPVQSTWSSPTGTSFNLQLNTFNNLQADAGPSPAVAAPGQMVKLLSSRSFSTNSTISQYSWTQTGGPTATLNGASSATASLVVPVGAQTGDKLHFNLTITDANGSTDAVPVTVFVLSDLTQPFLYYRQEQGAAVGQAPEVAILESPANGTVRTEFGAGDPALDLFRFISTSSGTTPPLSDELQFFTPGTALTPRTYTSASTPGGQPFFLLSLPFQCNYPAWTFTIYEAVSAPDGTAAKFSADFTQACPGGVPAYVGSVRVNSTVPLP
jgi:ELWxxDGT repeat protein